MKYSLANTFQTATRAARFIRPLSIKASERTSDLRSLRRFPLLGERTDGLLSLGGKAEALNRLRAKRLPVPPGFVLPSTLYGDAIEDSDLSLAFERLHDAGEMDSGTALDLARRETIALHRLEQLLGGSLDAAVTSLPRASSRFAVRSSATGEDGALNSFAGVLTTVLDVAPADLPAAILLCWSAAKTRRFSEYCAHIGMAPSLVSIAVLIQPMVPARCAGVLLTHDPISGEPGPVIEAVAGQGNKLVSGDVEPEGYRLRSGEWVRSGGAPYSDSDPLLKSRDLRALKRLSERVLRLQRTPQDLEWAFEGGKLWLLQARPITTLPQQRSVWTRANLRELYPEVPSPMAASLLQRFRKYQLTAHLASKGLRLWHSGPWLRIIKGRPYLNHSLLEALAGAAGFDSGAVSRSIGGVEADRQTEKRWDWRAALKNAPALVRLFAGYLTAQQRAPLLIRRLCGRAKDLDRRDLDRLTDRQLFNAAVAVVRETGTIDDLAGDTMGGVELFRLAAEKLLEGRVPSPSEFLAVTTVASANNLTARQLRETQCLAAILREDTAASILLRQDAANLADVGQFDGTTFGKELRRFLQRYGTRGIHESDCAVPRLEEDPAPLLLTLRAGLERPERARVDEGKNAAVAAWRNLAEALPRFERVIPVRLWLLKSLVGRLRAFYALRERVRFTDTILTSARRRVELTLGRRWEQRGWLETAADYYWLRLEDVERALSDPRLGESGQLRLRVETWKERHAAWAAEPMPTILTEGGSHDEASLAEQADLPDSNHAIKGLPISPGKVRGVVTLLSEVSNGDLPAPDRILVAPVIGPSWAPLLARAKGVVVETGGMLSHGSILAREYGVPGIANIPNVMTLFREGEEVVLDGTNGSIRRIGAPEEEALNGHSLNGHSLNGHSLNGD